MSNPIYVTFTYSGKKYAISCNNEEEANKFYADVCSLGGARYARFNKTNAKGRKILSVAEYKKEFNY